MPWRWALQLKSSSEVKDLRSPNRFGDLEKLETLNLNYCYTLESLPERFEDLVNLKHLDLRYCEKRWRSKMMGLAGVATRRRSNKTFFVS